MTLSLDVGSLRFDGERGTVVVVAQDAITGRVLMVANADREALEATIRSGEMHYRSRTRGLWHKGATSGNVQRVISLSADCDRDTVLARVLPAGPACHAGELSCFGNTVAPNAFSEMANTISLRAMEPGSDPGDSATPSYTRKLLADRNLRLKKIGEEGAELVAACADGNPKRATEEAADLIYHVAVALKAVNGSLEQVAGELFRRANAREDEATPGL